MQERLNNLAQGIKERLNKNKDIDFEIYLKSKQGTNINLKSGKKETYEKKDSLGFSLRILKNEQMAFSYGTDFSNSAIDHVIKLCIDSLPHYSQDKNHAFSLESHSYQKPVDFDSDFQKITLDQKYDFLNQLNQEAVNSCSQVKLITDVSLEDEQESTLIINSNGLDRFQTRTLYNSSVMVVVDQNQTQEIAYDSDSQVSFNKINNTQLAKTTIEDALELLGGKTLANYSGPIILRSNVVSTLMKSLAPSFYANNVFNHNSSFEGQLGKSIYAKQISLVDDPTLMGRVGSTLFDDEGCLTKKTELVDQGVLKGFLYNLYWANRLSKENTGHSKKNNMISLPAISNYNFYLEPGDQSLEDLVSELNQGILITKVIGAHTANTVSGEISVGIQGLKIDSGKVGHAVRNMVLTDNLHRLLKDVASVGNDQKFYGSHGGVSLLVNQSNISGIS